MRLCLVLVIALCALLAFGVACGDDEKGVQVMPSRAIESEGEGQGEGAEDWEDGEEVDLEEGEGAEGEPEEPDDVPSGEVCDDFDMDDVCDDDDDDDDNDGFSDADENHYGSDPLDDASVPESEDGNAGSCTDGVDNDLDGDTDDADEGCTVAFGFRVVSANLGVTPRDYLGPCPVRITFAGTITLEAGSGTVSYNFAQSDGVETSWRRLTFDSPGTQDVRLSMMMFSSFSGWAAIRIHEPEEHESNRANYTITCEE